MRLSGRAVRMRSMVFLIRHNDRVYRLIGTIRHDDGVYRLICVIRHNGRFCFSGKVRAASCSGRNFCRICGFAQRQHHSGQYQHTCCFFHAYHPFQKYVQHLQFHCREIKPYKFSFLSEPIFASVAFSVHISQLYQTPAQGGIIFRIDLL